MTVLYFVVPQAIVVGATLTVWLALRKRNRMPGATKESRAMGARIGASIIFSAVIIAFSVAMLLREH